MAKGSQQQQELGAFLRRRREQLDRDAAGLPPVGRSRTSGLRREEVAFLAGVSVTWYTWLEQGRAVNPSRQVLDAIARTLRLTADEHAFLLGLAGFAALRQEDARPVVMPDSLQRLLDAFGSSPTFVTTPDWTIVGWNAAYTRLYPAVEEHPAGSTNLLEAIFTDPYVRDLLPDWDVTSRRFLAEFRRESGLMLAQPSHLQLVERLRSVSPEFARAWDERGVERFTSQQRHFTHPSQGPLSFEQHQLTADDAPDLHVVVYLAQPS